MNFARTYLNGSHSSSTLIFNVSPGTGTRFTAGKYATVWDTTGYSDPIQAYHSGKAEIVLIVSPSANAIEIMRGQLGTSALNLNESGHVYQLYEGVYSHQLVPVLEAGRFLYSDGDGLEWVDVTKSTVGLSNVDNTSDANKPVSTAQQTALNGKSNTGHTHTISEITDYVASTEVCYQAYCAQTGTNAPVPSTHKNNTGLTFTWTYVGAGNYRCTLSGSGYDFTLWNLLLTFAGGANRVIRISAMTSTYFDVFVYDIVTGQGQNNSPFFIKAVPPI